MITNLHVDPPFVALVPCPHLPEAGRYGAADVDEGPQLAQRHARAQAGRQPDHLGPEYLDAGGGEIMLRGH